MLCLEIMTVCYRIVCNTFIHCVAIKDRRFWKLNQAVRLAPALKGSNLCCPRNEGPRHICRTSLLRSTSNTVEYFSWSCKWFRLSHHDEKRIFITLLPQDVPSVACPTQAASLHRKPASAGTSHEASGDQHNDKRNALCMLSNIQLRISWIFWHKEFTARADIKVQSSGGYFS